MKPQRVRSRSISLISIVVIALGLFSYDYLQPEVDAASSFTAQYNSGDTLIHQAFQNRSSDVQVSGTGVVIKTLPDDLQGSRHQKFLLKLSSGQTLLVAHNIDLAPRISSLSKGDSVSFNGVYEWNAKGGVLHWTHHDPAGRHEGGWLKYNGRLYQ